MGIAVLEYVETKTDAPANAGLTFRTFRGETDYALMHGIIAGSKSEDQSQWTTSVEDIARNYRHLVNCDPYQDLFIAEMYGKAVGYSRVWWQQELEGTRL